MKKEGHILIKQTVAVYINRDF